MTTAKLFANGHELQIDKRIGRGGEGEVFAVSNMPGFAVKAYLPGLGAEREKKIRAMVGARLADSAHMVAFPYQVVVNGRGAFVGFVMRLVTKHKEIHELQTPSSRQKHFPKADYGFIVRVALNIARVFAQVHASGCVVGDINQRGILVSPDATVALIDADSFQVSDGAQRYLCIVGVPEYTPPELQGKSLKSVVRTTNHDAFGLAVCLFQLLCMDRHPFSGRFTGNGDMPLEKAIAEFRFPYSAIAKLRELEERIKKAIDEFRQEAQGFERWRATRDPELVRLAQQLEQAEVDLCHVGIPVPSRPNVAPTPIQQVSAVQRATQPINSGGTWPPPTPVQPHAVTCPRCGDRMMRRAARRGAHVGQPFWGCSRYPICSGTRPI